jgi:hypothetical protein
VVGFVIPSLSKPKAETAGEANALCHGYMPRDGEKLWLMDGMG